MDIPRKIQQLPSGTAWQRQRQIISFTHEGNKMQWQRSTSKLPAGAIEIRELPGVPSRPPRMVSNMYDATGGWKTGLILSPTLSTRLTYNPLLPPRASEIEFSLRPTSFARLTETLSHGQGPPKFRL